MNKHSVKNPKSGSVMPVEEPNLTGRKIAIKEDSLLKILFTENFQRKGSNSFGYNEALLAASKDRRAAKELTAGHAINKLHVPRHHLLFLKKEGKIEVVSG